MRRIWGGGDLAVLAVVGVLVGPSAAAVAAPANGLAGVRNKISIATLPTSGACFDGGLGNGQCLSFSAVALAAAGALPGADITVSGVHFAWPDAASGQPDSMTPNGQTLAVNAPASTSTLALLGAAHNGPVPTQVTLTYSTPDASGSYTGVQTASVPDWWPIVGAGATPAANELRTAFQVLNSTVPVPVPVSVYALKLPVETSRRLVSVAFPSPTPSVAFFDLQLVRD